MRVLVIEDDQQTADYITKGLKESGHNVDCVNDGQSGCHLARNERYDILIIDRMLPEKQGIEIIKELRDDNIQTPALILSALGNVDDKVTGLRAGGDDYLVKPFAFSELLARVEVLAKRFSGGQQVQSKLYAADVEMDLLSRKVTRSGQNIPLQSREFSLLEYMIRNKGQLVTRTMLLEAVWDYHFYTQTNVIDVHISRLRKKLDNGFEQPIIKTIRGSGYIIDD